MPITVSRLKVITYVFPFFCAVVFLSVSFLIWNKTPEATDVYPENILALLFFMALGTGFALYPWLICRTAIYEDRIERYRPISGRKSVISRDNLIAFEMIPRRYKSRRWEDLKIYTPDGSFTIYDGEFENFDEIRAELIKGLPSQKRRNVQDKLKAAV